MQCSLCTVIANAVEQRVDDRPLESVTLHTSSVGGPLDMIAWFVDGETRSFELYTHSGEHIGQTSRYT
jgi:hypothetical protein